MTTNRVQTVRRVKAAVVGLGAFAALGSAIAIGAATNTGATSDNANQGQSGQSGQSGLLGQGSQRVHVVGGEGDDQGEGDDGQGRVTQTQQVQQAPPGGLQQGQPASSGSSHTTSSGS